MCVCESERVHVFLQNQVRGNKGSALSRYPAEVGGQTLNARGEKTEKVKYYF